MMKIDLRSDTVTKPTPGMLEAMMRADVGDDVFGEDPTINRLEKLVAEMFGHEAALFCASGTMANQIAVKAHTQPMDEIILDRTAHIYYYETAGFAFHSGVSVKLVDGDRGRITPQQVLENIQPDFDWLPKTSLVCLENTTNKGGGACYELESIQSIYQLCQERHLRLHIDGARIFNAIVSKGYSSLEIGRNTDSIAVCFSKGLGAPVGSVLVGNKEFIRRSKRIRKVFGGGMRQAGYLAAACLYALEHHIDRLNIDHQYAGNIAEVLASKHWVKKILYPETNILIFSLDTTLISVSEFITRMAEHNIQVVQFGPSEIRMVFHLDVSEQMILKLTEVLNTFLPSTS
jgi:threonine aldolase